LKKNYKVLKQIHRKKTVKSFKSDEIQSGSSICSIVSIGVVSKAKFLFNLIKTKQKQAKQSNFCQAKQPGNCLNFGVYNKILE